MDSEGETIATIPFKKRTTAIVHDRNFEEICDEYPAVKGRASLVYGLLDAYGMLNKFDLRLSCTPATREELRRFHSEELIDALLSSASLCDNEDQAIKDSIDLEDLGLGYDCAVYSGLGTLVKVVAGGTLTAARALCSGKADVAVNWSGGWHHAHRGAAAGFCYVNDIVLGMLELRTRFPRLLYIDLDVHHGDGVEEAFSTTNAVLTLSLHLYEPGFFPGTGGASLKTSSDCGFRRKACVNVPLKQGIRDACFASMFERVIGRVREVFQPVDAVVCQCGCDGLAGDPLGGGYNLTPNGLAACLRTVLSWHLPTLILGGGGYHNANAARCWTRLTATILSTCTGCEEQLDPDIPEHDGFEEFGPSFELDVEPGLRPDCNTDEYLEEVFLQVQGFVVEEVVPGRIRPRDWVEMGRGGRRGYSRGWRDGIPYIHMLGSLPADQEECAYAVYEFEIRQ